MPKPIVVCGVDFSGTSMVAGMLHAAGIDMGDVESAADVAALDRPVKYRTFEDRELNRKLKHLAELQITNLPDITHAWIEALYEKFMGYMKWREVGAQGNHWGVKCNGLVFLAMHEKFEDIPVEWVTTERDLQDSMESAFSKLGRIPRLASLVALEFLASELLFEKEAIFALDYENALYAPETEARFLGDWLGFSEEQITVMTSVIAPYSKGVIAWHG